MSHLAGLRPGRALVAAVAIAVTVMSGVFVEPVSPRTRRCSPRSIGRWRTTASTPTFPAWCGESCRMAGWCT